jgi:hypothetical protein
LFKTFWTDPGYLPASLKRDRVNGMAPLEEMRLFQMEHYIKNKLYDFNEYFGNMDNPMRRYSERIRHEEEKSFEEL